MVNWINGDMDASLPTDHAASPWISFRQRLDLTVEQASPRIEEFTGIPVQRWNNDPKLFWQVVHEGDVPELKDHLQNAPATVKETTFRLKNRQSGRVAYVWEIRRPLLDPAGELRGYECVWLDMTRRILAENRMIRACWKEALSSLTMGLTHDFNNILAGILSMSDFFLGQTDPKDPLHETLTLIRDNSRQATQIVHLLHQLHHARTGDRNFHDLNELTRTTVDLLQRAIPRRIEILRELSGELMPLHVDAVELQQAIVHVALNAAEAMPQSGRLRFKTSLHRSFPAGAVCRGTVPPGPCLCLSIEDNGPGIKAARLSDIFDPYYTTKAFNKGTGLGLHQASRCVSNNGGAMTIESSDFGSAFRIWLPQADLSDTPSDAPETVHPDPTT